jgi:hypothetical protein
MLVRFIAITTLFVLLIPQLTTAQGPVVSPGELRSAIAAAAKDRQKNLDDVREFFGGDRAQSAMKAGKVDYQKVQKAVATLSPEELARLAAKTNQIQADFAAGALSNQELTYIVIALATAVIVLVLVH